MTSHATEPRVNPRHLRRRRAGSWPRVAGALVLLTGMLTLAPATAASATVKSGGVLTSTVPVHPVIAVAGNQVQYTFDGVAAQHVTFDVSATSWVNGTLAGGAYLVLLNPAGSRCRSREWALRRRMWIWFRR